MANFIDSLIGTDELDEVQAPGPFRTQRRARLLQYLLLGGDTSGLEISRKEFRALSPDQRIKRKGRYFRLPTQGDLVDQSEVFSQQQVDAKEAFRKQLQDIPEIRDLTEEAAGRGDDLVQAAFDRLGAEVLGAAAPRGLLYSQAPGLLGSVALGEAQFQRGIQERSRGQLLSILGLGGPQGFDPAQTSGLGAGLNAFQLTAGLDSNRANIFNEALGARIGARAGLFDSILGAAASGAGSYYGAQAGVQQQYQQQQQPTVHGGNAGVG